MHSKVRSKKTIQAGVHWMLTYLSHEKAHMYTVFLGFGSNYVDDAQMKDSKVKQCNLPLLGSLAGSGLRSQLSSTPT